MDELIGELAKVLPPKSILSDPADLVPYESDAFSAERTRPACVVFPTTTEQVVDVVKLLETHDTQIIPRGAGTGLTGGCVAFQNGVIISTARLNRILKIDLDNRGAHVESGVKNLQLSEAVALLPNGSAYHFAPDPTSQRTSSIGGNAATNAGGVRTLTDFVTSSHVLGVEMVLADGQVLDVGGKDGSYDSAGFDLPGLICGSEGTLGIITKLWVRLSPKPAGLRTILGLFPRMDDALDAAGDIIAAGILPAAMELLDGGLVKVIESAFHLGFAPDAGALLLTEIDGIEPLMDAQMKQVSAIYEQHHALSVQTAGDPAGRTNLWRARKSAFGAIGSITRRWCTQDACVPRSSLTKVLREIGEISRRHGITIHTLAHAADGNLHPIFLYDDRDEAQVKNTLDAVDEVLKCCIDAGGTFAGEHGVGLEKRHLMPLLFDEPTLGQFEEVKACFDPDGRINAGKRIAAGREMKLRKPGRLVPQ